MPAQFSEDVLNAMRARSKAIKARMSGGGGDFSRYANLVGKRSIVEPGKGVLVRLLPRWDFVEKRYIRDPKSGRITGENPKYQREEACYPAWEHWFEDKNGKTTQEWCRKNLGEHEKCPGCEAADALKGGNEAERKQGKRMEAKEVYLYNAILRKTPFGEDGKLSIRILKAPGTVYSRVLDIITGADEGSYALGDVTDPYEGYDLQIIRPESSGDRYNVISNPKGQSRLHEQGDPKWTGWFTMLHDLEKDVLDNISSIEDFEAKLYEATTPSEATSSPNGGDELPSGGETSSESEPGAGGGATAGDFDLPGGEASAPPPASSRAAAPTPGRSSSRQGPGRRR